MKFICEKCKEGVNDFQLYCNHCGSKFLNDSVSEDIAKLTGTIPKEVERFIVENKLDSKKVKRFVSKNLDNRLRFVTALAGKPNNKEFKFVVKSLGV